METGHEEKVNTGPGLSIFICPPETGASSLAVQCELCVLCRPIGEQLCAVGEESGVWPVLIHEIVILTDHSHDDCRG